jgi:hypothetical protein
LPNCPYFIEKRSPFDDGCDEELELLENHLAAVRAKTIKRLKLVTGKELEPQDATHLDGDQLIGLISRAKLVRKIKLHERHGAAKGRRCGADLIVPPRRRQSRTPASAGTISAKMIKIRRWRSAAA